MNKKLALVLACCFTAGLAACTDDNDDKDCTNGDRRCTGAALEICQNNVWVQEKLCEGETPYCDPEAKMCTVLPCTPGEKQCKDNAVMECDQNKKWVLSQTCLATETCDASSKSCVPKSMTECTAGATKCEGSSLVTCDAAGKWGAAVECTGDTPVCGNNADGIAACVAGEPVPGCTPGSTACDGNSLKTCSDEGLWEVTACENPTPVCGVGADGKAACVAGEPIPGCTPGSTACEGNGLLTCGDDGNWGAAVECTGDTPKCGADADGNAACVADEIEPECVPDSTLCDGNSLKTCSAEGRWGIKACADPTPVCGADADGKAACVAASVNDCDIAVGGKPGKLAVDNSICDPASNKILKCVRGEGENPTKIVEIKCADNQQICHAGDQACVDPANCTLEDHSVVNHGEKSCSKDGGKVMICKDGNLVESSQCNASQVCDPVSLQCVAQVAKAQCDAAGGKINHGVRTCAADGNVMICNDGTLELKSECTDGLTCDPKELICKGASYTTIKAIRDQADTIIDPKTCGNKDGGVSKAADVKVKGIVTFIDDDGKSMYIQDNEAGILVYCPKADCTKDVSVGNEITLTTDRIGQYYCQLQISTENVLSIQNDNKIHEVTPIEVTMEEINNGKMSSEHHNMLVRLKGMTAAGSWKLTKGADTVGYTNYLYDKVKSLIVEPKGDVSGKTYERIDGILIYAFGGKKVAPRYRGDIMETVESCKNKDEIICNTQLETEYKRCNGEIYIPTDMDRGLKCENNALSCVQEGTSCQMNFNIVCQNGVVSKAENCANWGDADKSVTRVCSDTLGCMYRDACDKAGDYKCDKSQGYKCTGTPLLWVKEGNECSKVERCTADNKAHTLTCEQRKCTEQKDCQANPKEITCNTEKGICEFVSVEPPVVSNGEIGADAFSVVEGSNTGLIGKAEKDYYNSYQWSAKTADLNDSYVKISLNTIDVTGKTEISAAYEYRSNGTNVTKAVAAFYNGDTALSTPLEVELKSKSGLVKSDVFKAALPASVTDLHIRVAGIGNGTTKSAGLRVYYPVKIFLK